jgi:hypothetical protein
MKKILKDLASNNMEHTSTLSNLNGGFLTLNQK